ncbi:MAG: glycine zipper 2TM domain-containing protein [Gammaproteobacteria bacterium]
MKLVRNTMIGLAALGSGACAPAFADHPYSEPYDSSYHDVYDRHYTGDDYANARVVYVEPLVRYVRVQTPRRECYDDVEYYADDYDYEPRRGTAGASIAGGLIGGLIGHQFGSNGGNDAATLVGTLVGSSIARDRAERRQDRSYGYRQTRAYPVERCHVSYDAHEEERIDGYRVTYEYDGREYTTRTRHHPGDTIRVRVAVTPVGDY